MKRHQVYEGECRELEKTIREDLDMDCQVQLHDTNDRYLVCFPGNGWAVVYTYGLPYSHRDKYKMFTRMDHPQTMLEGEELKKRDLWLFPRSGELVARCREKLECEGLVSDAVDFYEKVIEYLT